MYLQIEQKRLSTKFLLMSILMAIYIDLPCIMIYLFPSVDGITDTGGILSLFYIMLISVIVILAFITKTLSFNRINYTLWITIIGIIIFYEYSILTYPKPRTPFNRFFVFTIVSLILPTIIRIDVRTFLKTIMILSVPAIFKYDVLFLPLFRGNLVLSMGYCYSFLTPVVCSIIYYKYFMLYEIGWKKRFIYLVLVVNITYAFLITALGSRGPVVAILFLIVLPNVVFVHTHMKGVYICKNYLFKVLGLIFIVIYFFVPILEFIQLFLSSYDVSLNFIDKFLDRNDAGDMTSNRSDIFSLAIDGFLRNPLLGNGFDQFENNTGWVYPHNFFSQILYDGGVALFSITIVPVVVYLKKWYSNCSFNEFIVILSLFFSSVPGACFSGDLWTTSGLWFFMGSCLNYKKFVLQ